MRLVIEEYGKVILVMIVVVAVLVCVFGVLNIVGVMGDAANVESNLSVSKSEEAVETITSRTKPKISLTDTSTTHLYIDDVFKPLATVQCTDADGAKIVVSITDMVFIDAADSSRTDVLSFYDSTTDEFDISDAISKTGTLAVSYKAVDGHSIAVRKTICFIIDGTS